MGGNCISDESQAFLVVTRQAEADGINNEARFVYPDKPSSKELQDGDAVISNANWDKFREAAILVESRGGTGTRAERQAREDLKDSFKSNLDDDIETAPSLADTAVVKDLQGEEGGPVCIHEAKTGINRYAVSAADVKIIPTIRRTLLEEQPEAGSKKEDKLFNSPEHLLVEGQWYKVEKVDDPVANLKIVTPDGKPVAVTAHANTRNAEIQNVQDAQKVSPSLAKAYIKSERLTAYRSIVQTRPQAEVADPDVLFSFNSDVAEGIRLLVSDEPELAVLSFAMNNLKLDTMLRDAQAWYALKDRNAGSDGGDLYDSALLQMEFIYTYYLLTDPHGKSMQALQTKEFKWASNALNRARDRVGTREGPDFAGELDFGEPLDEQSQQDIALYLKYRKPSPEAERFWDNGVVAERTSDEWKTTASERIRAAQLVAAFEGLDTVSNDKVGALLATGLKGLAGSGEIKGGDKLLDQMGNNIGLMDDSIWLSVSEGRNLMRQAKQRAEGK